MTEHYNVLVINDNKAGVACYLEEQQLPIVCTQVEYSRPTREWIAQQTLEHKVDALFVHVDSYLEKYCGALKDFLYESGEKFPACIYHQEAEKMFYTWSSEIEENRDNHPFIPMITTLTITYKYNEASIEDAVNYKIQSKRLI